VNHSLRASLSRRSALLPKVYHSPMGAEHSLAEVVHKMLQHSDLSFQDFMEVSLYHPELGYYSRPESPIGRAGDYVTSPSLSPVFGFSLGLLVSEFVGKRTDGLCSIVDVGCGDGSLIHSLCELASPDIRRRARFFGVDRLIRSAAVGVTFTTDLANVPPSDHQLVISNELFDALPFARLVLRGEHLHELWVTEGEDALEWKEHEADGRYERYFEEGGIELQEGQYADVSLEWEALYGDLCRFIASGLIITFDYGFPGRQLFSSRIRRFGTAAAYGKHRVTRDLLADPGGHDLTAHINFSDLQRAGEELGFTTLFFDRQAKFLLSLGATEHPLFRPVDDLHLDSADEALTVREDREEARRLILPDGMGEEIRVLVQGKGMGGEGWSFQRRLF
jgi:SAM-dependent MidA family methyltransferase